MVTNLLILVPSTIAAFKETFAFNITHEFLLDWALGSFFHIALGDMTVHLLQAE